MLSGLIRRRDRYPLPQVGETLPCNLCGSFDRVVIRKRDRYFRPLVNVMCRNCGLIFLDPMPNESEVADYYRHSFWSASQGGAEPSAKQLARDRRMASLRLEKAKKLVEAGARILDVGAGSGVFLAEARDAGFLMEGVEPNVGYARYAERTFGVKVHAGPLQAIDFGDRKFNLITCNHALEHMRDPLGALRRFHALLEPGGYIDVAVPDLGDPNSSPVRHLHAAHLFGFTHETLMMMMAKAGFEVMDEDLYLTIHVGRRLPAPDPDWFRYAAQARADERWFRNRTMLSYLFAAHTWATFPGRIGQWWRRSGGV